MIHFRRQRGYLNTAIDEIATMVCRMMRVFLIVLVVVTGLVTALLLGIPE